MIKKSIWFLPIIVSLGLSACGGGSGDSATSSQSSIDRVQAQPVSWTSAATSCRWQCS